MNTKGPEKKNLNKISQNVFFLIPWPETSTLLNMQNNLILNIYGESFLHNVQTLGIKIEDKDMIAEIIIILQNSWLREHEECTKLSKFMLLGTSQI